MILICRRIKLGCKERLNKACFVLKAILYSSSCRRKTRNTDMTEDKKLRMMLNGTDAFWVRFFLDLLNKDSRKTRRDASRREVRNISAGDFVRLSRERKLAESGEKIGMD